MYLPPYSPELNPKENLWDEIREKISKNYLRADIDKAVLKSAVRENGVTSIDDMPALDDSEVDAAANIVGQMGMHQPAQAFPQRMRRRPK